MLKVMLEGWRVLLALWKFGTRNNDLKLSTPHKQSGSNFCLLFLILGTLNLAVIYIGYNRYVTEYRTLLVQRQSDQVTIQRLKTSAEVTTRLRTPLRIEVDRLMLKMDSVEEAKMDLYIKNIDMKNEIELITTKLKICNDLSEDYHNQVNALHKLNTRISGRCDSK